MSPEDDPTERWWNETPEPKLELIDGRLIISTLAGSRYVLWQLLDDFGPPIALPHASADLWWAALREAFRPQPEPHTPEAWAAWAETFAYDPEPEPAGPRGSVEHREARERLQHGLYVFAGAIAGAVYGRDVVVRLGENGLTPDLFLIDRRGLERMQEYYLEGPPALAIEITLEGSADQDRVLKRRLYEAAGVPEYWIIDADARCILFLRRGADGRYHPVTPDNGGTYRSAAVPDLTLSLPHLWNGEEFDQDQPYLPFLPPPRFEGRPRGKRARAPDALRWGSLPFVPRVALQPVPVRFEEYISWCPEAKFERYGGGLAIGGHEGSRHVLGLLLMTFGLTEVVRRARPRDWVVFLTRSLYEPAVQPWVETMLHAATYRAHELGRGEVYYGAEIPQVPDLWVCADTETECRQALAEELLNRELLDFARGKELRRTTTH